MTATTFNDRSPLQLRVDFDVLAFPRAADQTLPPNPDSRNVAWPRLAEYLNLGGSIIWEDPIHIGGFAGSGLALQPSAVGGGAAISAPVTGLTDGIQDAFFNSHMIITSISSAWTQFLRSGGSNVGVYRDFASGGRMILTGTDQMTKAIKDPAPGTSNIVAAANQYELLLNEFRFSVANQSPLPDPPDTAEALIVAAGEIVAELAPNQVTNQGNQQAFRNFLRQAVVAIQEGDLAEAIQKLQDSIKRTDGCSLNDPAAADGKGPGRDWITDDPNCEAQVKIYDLLKAALDSLTQ